MTGSQWRAAILSTLLAAGPFAHGWGFPNFSTTITVMNNDLQAVINGSMTTAQMLADVSKSLEG